MQSQPLAIEMAGLTKQFGPHRAVDSLSLAVHSGSVFGFLGPNGAGKTTTIRMLLGLIRPTKGSGRILGYDIERERAAILPKVGAIVESPAFYPILSGYDNLRVLDRTAGKEDLRNIHKVLEQVGLSERAKDKVKTYSLGMKQRLAIAASLLNNPQIIFLDEPTNGLDPAGTVEIRELIGQLGASGHTIFLSSHLLHEVEQVCSEVAIINHGKLVAPGSRRRPASQRVQPADRSRTTFNFAGSGCPFRRDATSGRATYCYSRAIAGADTRTDESAGQRQRRRIPGHTSTYDP